MAGGSKDAVGHHLKALDTLARKVHSVCPWWIGYLLASPIRKIWQDPKKILATYVREGQTVLEPGPGMGFFTLELARLVGARGRVVAVDVQPQMISGLKRRASKAGLAERIDARVVGKESLGLDDLRDRVDFILAFAMVHEMPDAGRFFREVGAAAKKSATLLLAEPRGHVQESMFEKELQRAGDAGFGFVNQPEISGSHAALLKLSHAAR